MFSDALLKARVTSNAFVHLALCFLQYFVSINYFNI
jgi:hypothetical protein